MHKSNLYELYFWPDDPSSDRGQKYLQETVSYFQKLIDSRIISSQLLDKDEWNVLEICAGAGYGSLVLASLFPWKKVNVLVTDTRDLLMENARLSAILGVNNVNFKQLEAMQISELNKKFDMIIMYGFSTPHFTPKEAIKLYSKVKECLFAEGIFIVQEMDRRKVLFLEGNYHKKAYAEGYTERLVSEETGYNVDDGTVQRDYYSEKDPSCRVTSKSFFWSVAETDALLSLYWDKTDKISLGGDKYFLISSEPLNKWINKP